MYSNEVKQYPSKYIKNGKVDDVKRLIHYLKSILNNNIIKRRYIFILDTLLCNSDLFVYNYVFSSVGLVDYKIINDLDLIKDKLNEDNIIIMNWSSSTNYAYLNNKEVIVEPLNINIINRLDKKYIMLAGDEEISSKIKIPIYNFEYKDQVIFNYL